MAKPEWGKKHTCPNCNGRFYDLLKTPPLTCPMCEHVFEPSVAILNRKLKSKPEDDEIVQDDEEDVVDDRIVDVDDAVVDDDIIDDDDASVIEDDILLDENLDSDEDFGEEIIGEKHASIDEDIEETEK